MGSPERVLHFDNIHLMVDNPVVSARCTACGLEFTVEIRSDEHLEDVLLRVRDDFNKHICSAGQR